MCGWSNWGCCVAFLSLEFEEEKRVVLVLGVVVGDVSKRQREGTKRPLVKWEIGDFIIGWGFE